MSHQGKFLKQSDFARHMKVSRNTVSKWLKTGKITAPAVTYDNGRARIDPDLAIAQLRHRLDRDHARNGHRADVGAPTPLEIALKAARLEALELQNRRAAAEEAARAGKFVLSSAADAAMDRLRDEMLSFWDTALTEMADSQAGAYGLQRDAMRDLFNKIGQKARNEALKVAARRK